jgi:hypothetical protein
MSIKTGDTVRYHPIIGGKHDGNVYAVTDTGTLPNGQPVAWLEGKAGCVAMEAVSRYREGADNYGLPVEGGAA